MLQKTPPCLCVVLFLLALSLLAGCQSGPKRERALVFFPAPPAEPRVQFLTSARGAGDMEGQRSGFADFVLGDEPTFKAAIQKPYGIAAKDGVVYVCDTKGLNVSRLDFVNKTFSALGASGPGRLRKPLNMAIDPLGYKFVVDSDRKQVVIFGPDDAYVTAFNVPEPCKPVDLALYENELYVLDNDETCQVVVMDRKSGSVIRTFGQPGGEPGQFKIPNSIAVSPDGFVYISDTHNWRIQKLTREGKSVWVKGEPGYMLGQFGRPRGIRVGPDGIVYVVDGATEIVQMYDPDGNTLMRFGGPGDGPGALGLPSTLYADATSIEPFRPYIHDAFQVDYLLFVASQYGERLVNVYAFGKFPPGYKLRESEIKSLQPRPVEEGIGPVRGDETPGEPPVDPPPHNISKQPG
jgi:sugar lactone lactonase YvrE